MGPALYTTRATYYFYPINFSFNTYPHLPNPAGHEIVLQLTIRVSFPWQSSPPLEGFGLLHDLPCTLSPDSQGLVQLISNHQGLHCPSMGNVGSGINQRL